MDELSIAGVMLRPYTQVRDLGVHVDSNLSMSTHINYLTRTCFYHIRQLRTVRRSLTVDTTYALVGALVHSQLDYYNSVLAGQPKYCFDKLQSCFVPLLDLYYVYQAGWMSVHSSVDNRTGCHSREECSSSCALLSTSVSINWHQCTWVNCACRSQRTPADLIYVRLPLVTYLFLRLEQKQLVRMDFSHLVHPHWTSCLLTWRMDHSLWTVSRKDSKRFFLCEVAENFRDGSAIRK